MPLPLLNPWTYQYIRKLADEATLLAQQNNLRPVTCDEAAMNWRNHKRFNIPFLGDYVPAGWVRVDGEIEPFFVDTIGAKHKSNQVISKFDLYRRIIEYDSLSLGVIELGQAQALIALYRKEAHDKENQT